MATADPRPSANWLRACNQMPTHLRNRAVDELTQSGRLAAEELRCDSINPRQKRGMTASYEVSRSDTSQYVSKSIESTWLPLSSLMWNVLA